MTRKKTDVVPPLRGPTDLENEAMDKAADRLREIGIVPRYEVKYDAEAVRISPPHNDPDYVVQKLAAFGTPSSAFVHNAFNDLASVLGGQRGKVTELEMNAALAFIDGARPANEMEATLLIQMVSTHSAAMQCLRTATGDRVAATDGLGNLAVKLLRTYTMQVETLAKLRRKGEQVVRHIHVDNRGGQAVIAEAVHTGGGQNAKSDDQSHATEIDPAMLGHDPQGNGVPIPASERPEKVPNARRNKSGTAKGK